MHLRHVAVALASSLALVAACSGGAGNEGPFEAAGDAGPGGSSGATADGAMSPTADGSTTAGPAGSLPCPDAAAPRSIDHCGACDVRCRDDQLCQSACVDTGGSGTSCVDAMTIPQDDDEYGLRVPVAGQATRRPPCGPSGVVPVRWLRFTARQGHTLNGIQVRGGGPDVKVTLAAYLTPACDDASLPLCSFERDPAARKWPTVEPEISAGETVWLGVFVEGTPTEPLYVRVDD